MQTMSRHFFRRAGMPSNTSSAKIVPPPAPRHGSISLGLRSVPDVAAVVATVAVAVPVFAVALNETEPFVIEQEGRLVALLGYWVSAQLSATDPIYPVVVATVMLDVADEPGAIEAGLAALAATVKVGVEVVEFV